MLVTSLRLHSNFVPQTPTLLCTRALVLAIREEMRQKYDSPSLLTTLKHWEFYASMTSELHDQRTLPTLNMSRLSEEPIL